MKFRHSLLVRYLLIITTALVLWPFVLPLYYLPKYTLDKDMQQKVKYMDTKKLEQMWNDEAAKLNGAPPDQVDKQLRSLKERYSMATMFWVDAAGKTQLKLPEKKSIPDQWTFQESTKFMKKNVDNDLFTIIAFIGGDQSQGFMVFQVPLSVTQPPGLSAIDDKFLLVYAVLVFAIFLITSWVFFSKIRRRLVQLQTAMAEVDENGIPQKILIRKKDEIAQLGSAFNHMIDELINSRKREQEEEALRKQLIANISHDLRTPLTTIRGHAYSLQKETLSPKGRESLHLIERKVDALSQLLENLLSYTLLSAGKYTLQQKETDIIRLTRTSAAGWFPVFEKEGFEVEVRLSKKALMWNVDPHWFTRILDNLFQNAVRHAKAGRYVGVSLEELDGRTAVVVEDKGPGMDSISSEKGAGIGLSIVSLMLQEMNLEWKITSSTNGTRIYLYKKVEL
ncbi:Phosphotransferase RcsD [Bacillus rhizoplanae]|uniref:histidine kinase n=1 Tax=Bacillus rhizoplanae TaxID=2880966 RepID=A0ABM8YA45_9BACI|nr:HAMP domain-containing sensor histidine kinase [Bacillus rhizoplanae]CAG9612607.1 Phosphotransferase RcsD [Bacillus rhizoplanae]